MADVAPAEPASTTQNPSPTTSTPGNTASSKENSTGWTDPNYKPPAGNLGNLSSTQQKALDQFRKELQDEGHFVEERMDDSTLLRYCDPISLTELCTYDTLYVGICVQGNGMWHLRRRCSLIESSGGRIFN